ncbi:MAG TPA: type II toxin-antitoxin system VapC family toxin [Roseiarcus sp.]
MIAVDTNVIVRYLVADEPEQFRRATALMENDAILISSTVVLEAEWVLRSIYRLNRSAVLGALRKLTTLPTVSIDDPARLSRAFDWAERGMEFADALHLAAASACEAFTSFDRALKSTAAELGATPVRTP